MISRGKHKYFYGYVVATAGFFIQAVGTGAYSTYGVFFNSFLMDFSWSRALISGASALSFFLFGLFGILAGRLNDKIGPRMVMTTCGVFLGIGYALMSQVQSAWQLYLFYGLVVAIGFSALDVSTLSTIARWFVKKRGMMSGIIKAGAGLGILLMPLVANLLISSYGWRTAYITIGSIVSVFVVLSSQFLKRDPSKMGLLPYGAKKSGIGHSDSKGAGFSLKEAIHTRQFWMLCATYLLFGFCGQVVFIHSVPHAIDLGASPTAAAGILSIVGGVSIAGRFIMGSASDRIGSKLTHISCFASILVAFICLSVTNESWTLYLFAVLYGFAHGGLWALLSPMVAEIVGLGSHGAIFGVVYFSFTSGGTVGAVLSGWMYDMTGSYQLVFLICVVLSIIAIVLALLLKPITEKH